MAIKRRTNGGSKSRSSIIPKAEGEVQWEEAPTELTRRSVIMQIYGETSTGRTTLALTAPGPIALLHAAEKIDGVVQPFAREKEVRVFNFGGVLRGKPEEIAAQAQDKLSGFMAAWDDAFTWARTIVVDTHTEIWELLRLARFGTLTPRGSIAAMYGPLNAEFRSIFKRFREQDLNGGGGVNVIAVGQIRERYRNDKPTGKMEPAGQKEMPYYADITVQTKRGKRGEFKALIEKGWYDAHSEGIELEDDLMTFPMIMSMVTGLDPEDWAK